MHTTDDVSARLIIRFVIPLLILGGCWLYGFIKGLMEKDGLDSNNPKKDIKYYSNAHHTNK